MGETLPRSGIGVTPRPTKVLLVATLVVTAAPFVALVAMQIDGTLDPARVAPVLWLLTGLFSVRVTGQMLVAARAPGWLPPMEDWNLVPYRVLLPVQLAILAVMVWIDVSFTMDSGAPVDRSQRLGWLLVGFSAIYAGSMGVRYAVRMRRRPEARWFGGTIPMIFHLVLATYLYALGSFHVGS
jgi:hypothetical protein